MEPHQWNCYPQPKAELVYTLLWEESVPPTIYHSIFHSQVFRQIITFLPMYKLLLQARIKENKTTACYWFVYIVFLRYDGVFFYYIRDKTKHIFHKIKKNTRFQFSMVKKNVFTTFYTLPRANQMSDKYVQVFAPENPLVTEKNLRCTNQQLWLLPLISMFIYIFQFQR